MVAKATSLLPQFINMSGNRHEKNFTFSFEMRSHFLQSDYKTFDNFFEIINFL